MFPIKFWGFINAAIVILNFELYQTFLFSSIFFYQRRISYNSERLESLCETGFFKK